MENWNFVVKGWNYPIFLSGLVLIVPVYTKIGWFVIDVCDIRSICTIP
jgi:hypothetical protein